MINHESYGLSTNKVYKDFIPQGGDALQPSQYRPITISSNILKILTNRMNEKMMEIAEENKLLGPEQFGFRKKRSTTDAIFILSTLLKKAKVKR